jgi:hypothetical protein
LATIREDREANGIVGKSPASLVKSADGISKELEGFERCAGPVAHGVDMVGPVETVVEEKAQIPDRIRSWYTVVGLERMVGEVGVGWWVALLPSFAEEE